MNICVRANQAKNSNSQYKLTLLTDKDKAVEVYF